MADSGIHDRRPRACVQRNVPSGRQAPARAEWSTLMARAQEGDQQAYRDLLRQIAPYIRSLARRAGLAPDDCGDAVQDVLLTLHAVRHTYDPSRPFAPWLVGISRHRLTDHMRSRVRRQAREVELTTEHEATIAAVTANLETRDEARRLRAAVTRLPAVQRQAIELLKLKELSLAEAAASSGRTEGALKVSVHRAIKSLRAVLGQAATAAG